MRILDISAAWAPWCTRRWKWREVASSRRNGVDRQREETANDDRHLHSSLWGNVWVQGQRRGLGRCWWWGWGCSQIVVNTSALVSLARRCLREIVSSSYCSVLFLFFFSLPNLLLMKLQLLSFYFSRLLFLHFCVAVVVFLLFVAVSSYCCDIHACCCFLIVSCISCLSILF